MPAAKRAAAGLGVLGVGAAAVVGGNLFGLRDSLLGSATPAPRPVAVSPFVPVGRGAGRQSSVLRSQPWWQGVAKLRGVGTSEPLVAIDRGAIQWRARWTCRSGHMLLRAPGHSAPLVDAGCPAAGTATQTQTGETRLSVVATGEWTLAIDQQVDVPLVEPPLPSMTAAGTAAVSTGTFYRIDQAGTGRVDVYRLAAGGYVMRLSGFYVAPNVDLEIRLSPVAPHTTRQFLGAPSVFVAPLDITAGSLNFRVPRGVVPSRFRSVVIWCPLINSAYSAAALAPSSRR